MEHTEASIEVLRETKITKISVVMPIWSKQIAENVIAVNIPLFGLKTYIRNEDETQNAVDESLKCFFIASEKYGIGIEGELTSLGWKSVNKSMEFMQENPVMEQMMETGEQYYDQLELSEC